MVSLLAGQVDPFGPRLKAPTGADESDDEEHAHSENIGNGRSHDDDDAALVPLVLLVVPPTTTSNGAVEPSLRALAPDPVDDGREVVRGAGRLPVLDCLDDEAVPAGGAAHRSLGGPRADDPDRHPRALDRRRAERHRLEPVVLALERERLPGREAVDDRQRLVQESRPRARLTGSPTVPKPASSVAPRPTGNTIRPPDRTSRVVSSRASFHGRRRDGANTIAPAGRARSASPSRRGRPTGRTRPSRRCDRVVGEDAVPAGRLGLLGEGRGEAGIGRGDDDPVAHGAIVHDAVRTGTFGPFRPSGARLRLRHSTDSRLGRPSTT